MDVLRKTMWMQRIGRVTEKERLLIITDYGVSIPVRINCLRRQNLIIVYRNFGNEVRFSQEAKGHRWPILIHGS